MTRHEAIQMLSGDIFSRGLPLEEWRQLNEALVEIAAFDADAEALRKLVEWTKEVDVLYRSIHFDNGEWVARTDTPCSGDYSSAPTLPELVTKMRLGEEPQGEFELDCIFAEDKMSDEVSYFLSRRPSEFVRILTDTRKKIAELFGKSVKVKLEMHPDPDFDDVTMFILINPNQRTSEAFRLLDRFYEEWWLKVDYVVRGMVGVGLVGAEE